MSFLRNLSIKNKLVVMVLVAAIPSIIVGFSFLIIRDVLQLRVNLVNESKWHAHMVGVTCISALLFGDRTGVEDIVNKLLSTIPTIENGYIYDNDGNMYAFYQKGGKPTRDFPPLPPNNLIKYDKEGLLHVTRPILNNDKINGTVYLLVSTSALLETTRSRIITLLGVMLGLILFSYILALRIQGLISQPILHLAGVTEKISSKPDYSLRVDKVGRDEIGVLYDGFNNMLEQIHFWEQKRDRAEAEQRRLLEELAEKNQELEQVIYVTSHDLRSPLVNLQGFSQELGYSLQELQKLMERINPAADKTQKQFSDLLADVFDSLKYIQSSTSKMDALLAGLLKLSRVSRMDSTFEMIDMNRLIRDIATAFEFQVKEAGIKLRIEKMPPCFGNELQINQIFSNLLNNALKYLSPQRPGVIKISGQEITAQDNQSQVVYCVEDNGIGISPDYHKKIFELFSRLNPEETEGEGLGLTIVNKIVTRHHGKVWVESQAGEGSRFFVSFPIPPSQKPQITD